MKRHYRNHIRVKLQQYKDELYQAERGQKQFKAQFYKDQIIAMENELSKKR